MDGRKQPERRSSRAVKFLSGLANCHIPGLYSLVISERESATVGMRRIFYAGLDCKMGLWDGADFRIKPHNHRQDIRLSRLFGRVSNVDVKLSEVHQWRSEFAVYEYAFGSALLDGQFSLRRVRLMMGDLIERPLTAPIYLHWSNVHTVVAEPGSAWLVEEGAVAPEGMERCYSVSHRLSLSSEGLYRPLDRERLGEMAELFDEVAA